ncbi:MAG: ABC transporter permease [Planctomycetaceae bacterium]
MFEIIIALVVLLVLLVGGYFTGLLTLAFTNPAIGFGAAAGLIVVLIVLSKVPLSYNIQNLLVRWRTTLLTGLAFTLVLSLLTVMLAFVKGMYELTQSSGQPGNVLVLAEGSTDEGFSNLAFANVGDIEAQDAVAKDGLQPLLSRETYIIVNQPVAASVKGRPERRFLQMRGVDDSPLTGRVHGLPLYPGGSWLSDAGARELSPPKDSAQRNSTEPVNAYEVVVGEGIARELGADRPEAMSHPQLKRLDVGDMFPLNGRVWLIVGVLKSEGSTFDSEVWAKRSIVGPMFGSESYSTLVLKASKDFRHDQRAAYKAERLAKIAEATAKSEDIKKREAIAKATGKEFTETPDPIPTWTEPKSDDHWDAEMVKAYFNNDYKKASVNAIVETDYFESLNQLNQQFLYAIVFVTIILSIGGVFGVMNTMFAAISQRIKDIGVLRLLGYRRRSILVCFLLESVLIAMIGGLMGVALGSLSDGWTASSIVGSGQGGGKFVVLRLTVDAQVLAVGCLLSLLLGFVGGLIPSLSAMRLSALEALR